LAQDDYYYEIQLTNKQLVFYFLAGATGLVLSFLAGVMVGRGVDQTASADAQRPRPVAEDRIVTEEPEAKSPAPPATTDLNYSQRLESDKTEETLEKPGSEKAGAGKTAAAASAPATVRPAPATVSRDPARSRACHDGRREGRSADHRRREARSAADGRRQAGPAREHTGDDEARAVRRPEARGAGRGHVHDPGRRLQGQGERRLDRRAAEEEGLRGIRGRARGA
jgi:hypothetical protein